MKKKCNIVAYDELRSMIIYDTMPSIEKQWQLLVDDFFEDRLISAKRLNEDKTKNKILKDEWDYKDVRRSFIKNWGVTRWGGHDDIDEARIHNYKMIRLNDLVYRWIDL